MKQTGTARVQTSGRRRHAVIFFRNRLVALLVRSLLPVALLAATAWGCGWMGTDRSVRFNSWLTERDMLRLPPLPTMGNGQTEASALRDSESGDWDEEDDRSRRQAAEIDALWSGAAEATARGDLQATRQMLGRYLELTTVGRGGPADGAASRQERRNSAIDRLDALSALDRGAPPSAVLAYLEARRAYDAGEASEEFEQKLERAARDARLQDNAAYLRAALLYKSEEMAAAARAFESLAARHPRGEKREAALFMAGVANMKTSATYTGTSGDEQHLHAGGHWDVKSQKFVEPPAHPPAPPDAAWHAARALFERVLGDYPRGRFASDARGWRAHLLLRAGDRAGALVDYYRLLGDDADPNARVEAAFSLTLVRHHATAEEMRRVEARLEDEPRAALAYAYHSLYNYAVNPGCALGRWYGYYSDDDPEGQKVKRDHETTQRDERRRIVAFATRTARRHPGSDGAFALRVAQANSELGEDRAALEQSARALRLGVRDGERLRALWVKGASEHRLGEFAAARRTLAALIAEDRAGEFTEGARRILAMAAEDAGDLDAALEQYLALGYEHDAAYFIDVLMTTEQLAGFIERRPDSPQRAELLYSLGLRHLRAGRYAEARSTYARVQTSAAGADPYDYSSDDYDACAGWRRCSPKNPYFSAAGERTRWVLHDNQVANRLETLDRAAEAAVGDEARAEALYQLASYIYESSTLLFYNPAAWQGGRNRNVSDLHLRNGYRAPGEAQKLWDHMREHDTLARALVIYLRVADQYPNTRAARDALYTAAVCHDILDDFNSYWHSVYEAGLHAGNRRVIYDDVRRTYPGYQLPRGTDGWQPSTRTVNGGPGWAAAPRPQVLTRAERVRRQITRGERALVKGWGIFGEVAGGRARHWTLVSLRWALVALLASCVILVFRLTRRTRAALFELIARLARGRAEAPEVFGKPRSSYAAHEPYTAGARVRAASRRLAHVCRGVLLDGRGHAALAVNFAVHALLTLLLYALLWALRAG